MYTHTTKKRKTITIDQGKKTFPFAIVLII